MIKNLLGEAQRPLIMGIINCTPDSFYHESRKISVEEAVDTALVMIENGVDIIDIGGESSRPGSEYVNSSDELERVLPFLVKLRKLSDIPVSVDTRKSEVAEAVLDNGADIINDISALSDDISLVSVVKKYNSDIILMHKKGIPKDMQNNPLYQNAVYEIRRFLNERAEYAALNGIDKERIIIDPGIGFGKRLEDNISIINNIASFKESGYPVLIGHSRKSFIGSITARNADERLSAYLASGVISLMNGADILRVHDVKESVDTLKIYCAVKKAAVI